MISAEKLKKRTFDVEIKQSIYPFKHESKGLCTTKVLLEQKNISYSELAVIIGNFILEHPNAGSNPYEYGSLIRVVEYDNQHERYSKVTSLSINSHLNKRKE